MGRPSISLLSPPLRVTVPTPSVNCTPLYVFVPVMPVRVTIKWNSLFSSSRLLLTTVFLITSSPVSRVFVNVTVLFPSNVPVFTVASGVIFGTYASAIS